LQGEKGKQDGRTRVDNSYWQGCQGSAGGPNISDAILFLSLKMRSCLIAQPSAVSVARDVPGHRGDLPG
jgi:hypothetical protein